MLIFIGLVKTRWFKGVFGEFQVNFLLNLYLPKDTYHLIKNVTLPTDIGTTQIDHILVSKYGVFVLETKNMKGWIFGSSNQKQWTQKIFKHSSKFQNPIHQNYKHVKTLESLLAIPPESIFSVVVFIGDSTFKTDLPPNVTYARGCIDYIKSKRNKILSPEQVRNILAFIENDRLKPSFNTNREHVAHVREIIESKSSSKSKSSYEPRLETREVSKGLNTDDRLLGLRKARTLDTLKKIVLGIIIGILMTFLFGITYLTFVNNEVIQVSAEAERPLSEPSRRTLTDNQVRTMLNQQRDISQEKARKRNAEIKRVEKKMKSDAWASFYRKPEECRSYKSERHMIECANKRIRAKREFEKKWEATNR
jgi:hypothetical protein